MPPVDSLNQWPLLSGANATSPRREWSLSPFGTDLSRDAHGGDAAYMLWPYKLLVGHVQQSGCMRRKISSAIGRCVTVIARSSLSLTDLGPPVRAH